jgi:DnaJ family protein C protein 17
MADKEKDEDYYKTLGIEDINISKEQISKCFKKLSLIWHPDKRPNDPEAAVKFHQIRKAYEVLSDDKAREAYDNVLRAKIARKARESQMDSKRRKMKEDLENREEKHKKQKQEEKLAKARLEVELERLRKEGFSMMQKMKDEDEKKAKAEAKPKEKPVPDEAIKANVTLEEHEDLETRMMRKMMEAAAKQKEQKNNA